MLFRPLFTFTAFFLLSLCSTTASAQTLLPGFQKSEPFAEQIRWSRLDSGVRICIVAPQELMRPRRHLVIFATPNGNTVEQTLGCAAAKDRDWRFDIQHVAAQIRRWREIDTTQDIILAVVQAPRLSWPSFRRDHKQAQTVIHDLVTTLRRDVQAETVSLTCHSGGGSFVFGDINAVDELPAELTRIVFLDANYAYSDDEHHGEKLLKWIGEDTQRQLVVIAYDDREIMLNNKKVVDPDGGTFRASERMLASFRKEAEYLERDLGPFRHASNTSGQIQFLIHRNPQNQILHTALVGEMNGLLYGLTFGTIQATTWGTFGGPRAYEKWIQPEPLIDPTISSAVIVADAPEVQLVLPERPVDAPLGSTFLNQISPLPREQRETAIREQIIQGNVPNFLRRLIPIRIEGTDADGTKLTATCFVTSDYLAVGTDDDFFRLPMTPQTAVAIASAAKCSLITPKVSDDIFTAATVKLAPRPLTKNRDSIATFYEHHQIIEEQLRGKPRGSLVTGIKKDVVLTNRLNEKPNRVAIYGWHYPEGEPIQPLYVGHVDWYVDYSHGLRLMADHILIDGQRHAVQDVLRDPRLHTLLTHEGPHNIIITP